MPALAPAQASRVMSCPASNLLFRMAGPQMGSMAFSHRWKSLSTVLSALRRAMEKMPLWKRFMGFFIYACHVPKVYQMTCPTTVIFALLRGQVRRCMFKPRDFRDIRSTQLTFASTARLRHCTRQLSRCLAPIRSILGRSGRDSAS
jgi:hypothetical protein